MRAMVFALLFLEFSLLDLAWASYSKKIIEFIDASYDENKLLAQVSCDATPSCAETFLFTSMGSFAMNPFTIINNRFKILMEYTPKADCTVAVAMFLEQMGFCYGEQYRGWPQYFQEKYYDVHCGKAHPCMYVDPSWFRFKVTRNPFDRAVSSFLYILQNPPLSEKAIPAHQRENMSFHQFVDHLLTLSDEEMEYYGDGHGGFQSKQYERDLFQSDANRSISYPLFQMIFKVEEAGASIKELNSRFGLSFHLNYFPPHYALRHRRSNVFVGEVPFDQLRDGVPKNYAQFYSQEIRFKVQRRFHWDLLLYNYSYPF